MPFATVHSALTETTFPVIEQVAYLRAGSITYAVYGRTVSEFTVSPVQ